jgi:hypothetical protein
MWGQNKSSILQKVCSDWPPREEEGRDSGGESLSEVEVSLQAEEGEAAQRHAKSKRSEANCEQDIGARVI